MSTRIVGATGFLLARLDDVPWLNVLEGLSVGDLALVGLCLQLGRFDLGPADNCVRERGKIRLATGDRLLKVGCAPLGRTEEAFDLSQFLVHALEPADVLRSARILGAIGSE